MFDPPIVYEGKEEKQTCQKKDLKTRLLELWQNVSFAIVVFGLLVFLSAVPLLFNFGMAKWYAKILMIMGSYCAGTVFLALMFIGPQKSNGWMFYFSPLLVIYLIGIVAYFNFELWGQKSFILALTYTWTMFVGLFAGVKGLFNKTLGSENTPVTLIAVAILTLFMAVVSEVSANADSANLYYKISFGIVYLIAIALYANKYIYKRSSEQKIISNIIGVVSWGAFITITFPFYVQWCGLTDGDFETFISVYAAVLGGGITLAGVAWTIKDTNEKRQQDLLRIENERKEEERKKHIPYIRVSFNNKPPSSVVVNANITKGLDLEKEEDIALFKDNVYFSINIKDFDIKNISNENIIIIGVSIRGKFYKFSTAEILEPNECCRVLTTNSRWIIVDELDDKFSLYVADVVGNTYKMECRVSHKSEDLQYQFKIINEETYRWHRCSYIVTSVGLPKFIPR